MQSIVQPACARSAQTWTRQRTPCLLDTYNTQTNVWVLYRTHRTRYKAFSLSTHVYPLPHPRSRLVGTLEPAETASADQAFTVSDQDGLDQAGTCRHLHTLGLTALLELQQG